MAKNVLDPIRLQLDKAGNVSDLIRLQLDKVGNVSDPIRLQLDKAGNVSDPTRLQLDAAKNVSDPIRLRLDMVETKNGVVHVWCAWVIIIFVVKKSAVILSFFVRFGKLISEEKGFKIQGFIALKMF